MKLHPNIASNRGRKLPRGNRSLTSVSFYPISIISRAKREILLARDLDEVKDIRDKAEALRLYMKQQGDGLEMQNAVAEIKIRAERRAGEMLAEMEKNKGGPVRSHDTTALPPTPRTQVTSA